MTDYNRIPNRLDDGSKVCRVVVETPKGSRSKYTFDPAAGFEVSGLLPEGMSFPLAFGFVPSTRAEDGDPLDVLVLYDEPTVVGAVLDARLIGVIEAEQTEDGVTVRNDRLMAVAGVSRLYADIQSLDDLKDDYVDHVTEFWVQYNSLKGQTFKVLRLAGPEAAVAAVHKANL